MGCHKNRVHLPEAAIPGEIEDRRFLEQIFGAEGMPLPHIKDVAANAASVENPHRCRRP